MALAVNDKTVTREALLCRATQLLPVFKARAERAEQLRQLPPESVQDLIDSELIRVSVIHRVMAALTLVMRWRLKSPGS